MPNPNGKLKSFPAMRDLANLLCILFDFPVTKVGITFIFKKFTKWRKRQKKPWSIFLLKHWRFLCLKRCNLAAFELQLTLTQTLRNLLGRKKGKRNPVVEVAHSLILQIGVLYCLERLISAFQLV
jgi:hypothetical protein